MALCGRSVSEAIGATGLRHLWPLALEERSRAKLTITSRASPQPNGMGVYVPVKQPRATAGERQGRALVLKEARRIPPVTQGAGRARWGL